MSIDVILNEVRWRLRADEIELWKPPYLVNGEPQDELLEVSAWVIEPRCS